MGSEREQFKPLDPGFDISLQDAVNLGWLSTQLARGNLVVFIGAGVSRNAVRSGGPGAPASHYPLWADLIDGLANSIEETNTGGKSEAGKGPPRVGGIRSWPFPKIAGVYSSRFGRERLINQLAETLDTGSFRPGAVHQALVQMRWADIITTNYDDFIERAFLENGIKPHVISEDSMVRADLRKPWIVKMNGCLTGGDRNRIVIDDEDFRRYSAERPLIELFVKRSFIENYVLFIGFGMDDPAFQNIFGWIRDILEGREIHVYSVQWSVSDAERDYWQKKMISVIELHSSNIDCSECGDGRTACSRERVFRERLLKVLDSLRERAAELRAGRESDPVRQRTGIKLFVRLERLISKASIADSTAGFLDVSRECSKVDQLGLTLGASAYFDSLVPGGRRRFSRRGDEDFLLRLSVEVARGRWWRLIPEIKRFAMDLITRGVSSDETLGFYLMDDFLPFDALEDPLQRERWERLLSLEYHRRRKRDVRLGTRVVGVRLILRTIRDVLDMLCAGRVPVGESIRERVGDILFLLTRIAAGPKPFAEMTKPWVDLRQRVSLALVVSCALAGDLLWKSEVREAIGILCRWGLVDRAAILRWFLFRLTPEERGAEHYRFVAPDLAVASDGCERVPRSQRQQQRRGCCAWLWMHGAMIMVRAFLSMLDDHEIADVAAIVELMISGIDSQSQFEKWSCVAAWLSHQCGPGGEAAAEPSAEAVAGLDRTLFDRALRLQHIPPLALSERCSPAPDDFVDELFDRLLRNALRRPGTDLAKDVLRWVWTWAGQEQTVESSSNKRMERIESWTENLLRQTGFFEGASWISEIRLLFESGYSARLSDDLKTMIHDAALSMISEVSKRKLPKDTWYGEYFQRYEAWVSRLQLVVEELGWSRLHPIVQRTIITAAPKREDTRREAGGHLSTLLEVEAELDARIDFVLVACSNEDELPQDAAKIVTELVQRGGVGEVRSPLSRQEGNGSLVDTLLANAKRRWHSTGRVSMIRAVRTTCSLLRHLPEERAAEVESPFLSALFHGDDDVVEELLSCARRLVPSPWWKASGPRFLANLRCRFDTDSAQCARSIALFLQEMPAGDEKKELIATFVERTQFAEARRQAQREKAHCGYPRL